MTPRSSALEQLTFARRIADYADQLGIYGVPIISRLPSKHIGAALADAILQAGVSYHTVVRMRIARIHMRFPEAATMQGLTSLLKCQGAAHFLLWNHPIKLARFVCLAEMLVAQDIGTTIDLKAWLCRDSARDILLSVHGIGPKTFDYLSALVGIDCIAVDRHLRTFASEAGVPISDYDRLKSVVSYAADLLGLARRDFDSWIWQTISTRAISSDQLSLI